MVESYELQAKVASAIGVKSESSRENSGAVKQGGEVSGTQLNDKWVEKIGGDFSELSVGDKSSSVNMARS